MEHKPLKLAIVGGGIAGLSMALSLNKLIPDHHRYLKIDIYESTSSLKAQVGAGIGLWPFIWSIFEDLGLVEDLNKYTVFRQTDDPTELLQVRQGDEHPGRDLFRVKSANGRIIVFHRGDFQAVFLNHVPDSVSIHTKKRLDTYIQNDSGVVLRFEDGTTANADILIGADGLQSRVRRKLVEETSTSPLSAESGQHPADARWTGIITYRALVPREKILEQGFAHHRGFREVSTYVGKGASLVCYPVCNGASINFVGVRFFPEHEGTRFSEEAVEKILRDEGFERPKSVEVEPTPVHENVAAGDVWSENFRGAERPDGKRARWFTKVSPEEVKHVYKGWEPEVQALVNGVDSVICWAAHSVNKMKTYSHKRVCILGDAAHAMMPQHATGAASAICDSYLLAHLFASAIATDPSKLNSKINDILNIYDQVRRPLAEQVSAGSRAAAFHYNRSIQEGTPEKEVWSTVDTTKEEEVKLLRDHSTDAWAYAWDKESVPKSVEKAVKMLQERY